jgi:hypothetical protein
MFVLGEVGGLYAWKEPKPKHVPSLTPALVIISVHEVLFISARIRVSQFESPFTDV